MLAMGTLFFPSLRRVGRLALAIAPAWLGLGVGGARSVRADEGAATESRVKRVETVRTATAPGNGDARGEGAAEEPSEPSDPVLVRPFLQIMYASFDFDTDDDAAQLEIVPNPTSNLGVTLGAWGL